MKHLVNNTYKSYYSPCHVIDVDLAVDLGIEKSLIISNINSCRNGDGTFLDYDDLHVCFHYFKKKRFYKILNELLKSGHIREVEVFNE